MLILCDWCRRTRKDTIRMYPLANIAVDPDLLSKKEPPVGQDDTWIQTAEACLGKSEPTSTLDTWRPSGLHHLETTDPPNFHRATNWAKETQPVPTETLREQINSFINASQNQEGGWSGNETESYTCRPPERACIYAKIISKIGYLTDSNSSTT